ncbi:plasmid partitioning protein RepB (plasmid) [Peteryoungia desertarenae]|uniref:Plasmid partitioning protein RepB n=1 Tax=Peteryoungia desertarenae TaxID=1813451 RepID=A0ABX6QTJ9_9HYPH|nr:plasmid partitioning protein RepB [Peteryoungia desertarenae]QLF71530.1 plasmid partitioning protein RepB [Peteryoungia desertarenae]
MARKDIFANITASQSPAPERKTTPGYATRGASRSMINSLSELAEKAALAEQSIAGEAVVELDPALLDSSFVSDRMGEDEAAFQELVEAIRERGQDTPVLVRPHPTSEGRYQIVFGHRRVRAAKLLERPVKAVVKGVSDIDHVIAQGQENSARENLSFIERATFAQNLTNLGHDRRIIQVALSVDPPMLTRMLSVTSRVPQNVIAAIGSAKGIGRDRWLDLAQQIEHPTALALSEQLILSDGFASLSSEARFDLILSEIKKAKRPAKKANPVGEWASADAKVTAEFKGAGKSYSISLKSRDAVRFGRFIAENLEKLHEEFLKSVKSQGD